MLPAGCRCRCLTTPGIQLLALLSLAVALPLQTVTFERPIPYYIWPEGTQVRPHNEMLDCCVHLLACHDPTSAQSLTNSQTRAVRWHEAGSPVCPRGQCDRQRGGGLHL